jgi:hypothetical protein
VSDGPRFPLFTFDEDSHIYTVPMRGQVPACTRILDRGGLVSWDHVNRDILERKGELGREVHKACHLHNQKKSFTVDPQVLGYLNSWMDTAKRLRFTPRLSEFQQIASVNGMLYGMQIDAEGELPDGDTIIDYKIGEIMPHHEIQLAGYAAGLYHPRLETPLARFRTRKRIIVKLQEDGSLGKIHRCEDKSDFDTFTSALYTTYWKLKHERFYREITP